jgi:hypothetical protein
VARLSGWSTERRALGWVNLRSPPPFPKSYSRTQEYRNDTDGIEGLRCLTWSLTFRSGAAAGLIPSRQDSN